MDFFDNLGGQARYIYFLATPIFDNHGIMVGVCETLQDVTIQEQWRLTLGQQSAALRQENLKLKATIKDRFRFGEIIGKSSAMQDLYKLIIKAAATDLVARKIHGMSALTPYVSLSDCL